MSVRFPVHYERRPELTVHSGLWQRLPVLCTRACTVSVE